MFLRVVMTFIVTILLMVPIFLLSWLQASPFVCDAVILGSTLFFALIVAFFTKARRQDLFTATAAYVDPDKDSSELGVKANTSSYQVLRGSGGVRHFQLSQCQPRWWSCERKTCWKYDHQLLVVRMIHQLMRSTLITAYRATNSSTESNASLRDIQYLKST
jgi:hypothetical protein